MHSVETEAPTPIVMSNRLAIRMRNALPLEDVRSLAADVLEELSTHHLNSLKGLEIPIQLANRLIRLERELRQQLQEIGHLYPEGLINPEAAQTLLVELVANALARLPIRSRARSRADALIALRNPLPTEYVNNVLLSPDVLAHVVESLVDVTPEGELRGHGSAAAACSMWSNAFDGALTTLIRRHGYLHPRPPQRIKMLPTVRPHCLAEMPDGAICFHASGTDDNDEDIDIDIDIDIDRPRQRLRFLTAHGEPTPDGGAWADLTQVRFGWPSALQLHEEAMLVADIDRIDNDQGTLRRVRLSDGVELARSPPLGCIRKMCVHDGRCFVATTTTVRVLDVRTLELRYAFGEFGAAVDCAIWLDELYVADRHKDAQGSLQVFRLDGTHLRTVNGRFDHPNAIIVRNDRIYMLERNPDSDDDELDWDNGYPPQRLLVLALDGSVLQGIYLPDAEDLCSMCFCDGGRSLVIADRGYDGSESDGFPEPHPEPVALFRFQA